MFQRLKEYAQKSGTVLWGYIKIASGAFLLSSHEIISVVGDAITDPTIKSAMDAMNFPAYVGLGLVLIGYVTVQVRLRKSSLEPVNAT